MAPSAPSPDDDEAACLYAMQLAGASTISMALKAAIELELFETLSGGTLSSTELASLLPRLSNPDAPAFLDRILRLLASHAVLNCSLSPSGERRYSAAPVCKYLTSMAGLVLMMQDRVMMESWYHLKDAVAEGGVPFDKAFGMPAFEFYGTNPRFNKVFNEGMRSHSAMVMNKLLEIYKGFEGLSSLVDVGGGVGATLGKITAMYPRIRGLNFDLPHVISVSPPTWGVEHVGGDMFVSIPSADAIFMKWILHDWSDERCHKLLKNCWKALPENGKVIAAECFLPEKPEQTALARVIFNGDLIMLANTPGGKERTQKEFESMGREAGFSRLNASYIFSGVWVLEFIK